MKLLLNAGAAAPPVKQALESVSKKFAGWIFPMAARIVGGRDARQASLTIVGAAGAMTTQVAQNSVTSKPAPGAISNAILQPMHTRTIWDNAVFSNRDLVSYAVQRIGDT